MGELVGTSQREGWFKRSLLWDRRLDMLSGWGFAAALALGVVVVVAVALTASITVESRNCAYASREFGRPTHYDWLSTCWVKFNGQWVPRDHYQTFRQVNGRG